MTCTEGALPSPGTKVAVQGASADTSMSAEGRSVVESDADGMPAGQLYVPEHFPLQPVMIATPPTKRPTIKLRVFIPEA
jgi:hypothetical protein